MKHTKMFFALVVLAAAVLAFGCNQANTPSSSDTTKTTDDSGNTGGGSFTMSDAQKTAYDATITSVTASAATKELTAQEVTLLLQTMNQTFAALGFKVTDQKAGQPIAKGTTKEALKARFKPESV